VIRTELSGVSKFINLEEVSETEQKAAEDALRVHPMNGWTRLPRSWAQESIDELRIHAEKIRKSSDIVVIAGAGGSSLGANALISALGQAQSPEILWCGDTLSGTYMNALIKKLENRDFTVILSSKSGSTLETLIALRMLYSALEKRFGEGAAARLTVITEPKKSELRKFAEQIRAKTFEIPEDVGGRYSVFTAANLLPAAVCGADVTALLSGAAEEAESSSKTAINFAKCRNALYDAGYHNEIFASFEPSTERVGAWWRQLFGESEGKEGTGIFPSTVVYSGDLHSMGQYVQEGRRDLFETVISFASTRGDIQIPQAKFIDGLAPLDGKSLNEVNTVARREVIAAHVSGGVPVAEVVCPSLDERGIGALLYFFERVCAYSCFMRGIDPFYQPGVEAYKKRVKSALGI